MVKVKIGDFIVTIKGGEVHCDNADMERFISDVMEVVKLRIVYTPFLDYSLAKGIIEMMGDGEIIDYSGIPKYQDVVY